MEISKSQLQTALEIVKPGLANKELIEQSTSFAFIGDRVVTYNDDISISHPIEGLELTGAVKAEKLYLLLGKLKEDKITIDIEGSEILLKSGRAKAGLTLQQEIKLPLEEEIAYKEKWKTLPKAFLDGVDFAIGSCSKDMSRPVLTCVHVVQEGFVESSDSLRIMKFALGDEMPIESFLLPASAALTMTKLKPTKIAKGRGWIHFKTEADTILSCRIFEDKFPDTSPFLKTTGISITLPDTISAVLERASIFAKRDHMLDESVQITLEPKRLKIRGEADSGWFEESIRMEYLGEEVTFHITPHLLKGILSQTAKGILGTDRLKFEGENWEYVTALRAKK